MKVSFRLIPVIAIFAISKVSAQVSYAPQTDYPAVSNPAGVFAGDFDNDGKPDIAVAVFNGPYVAVFRNISTTGGPAFASSINDTLSAGPVSVYGGDIDGDGKMDLLATNRALNSVSFLKNTSTPGSISFNAPVIFSVAGDPTGIVVCDLDLDGKPDVAVSTTANLMSILRNTSTGGVASFAPHVDYSTANNSLGIAFGDITGDGLPDLAVANSGSDNISVFKNTSSGGAISFASKVNFATASNPASVAIGDLDGDGKSDLAVSTGSVVTVFRNTRTSATISFAARITFDAGPAGKAIAIYDVSGDGKPDLEETNMWGNSISVLENISSPGSINFAPKADFRTANTPMGIFVKDLDGDGKPDMITSASDSYKMSVFRNILGPPVATISGSAALCQNDTTARIAFSGDNGVPPYTFTYNINHGTPATISTTSGSAATLPVATGTAGTYRYFLTHVADNSGKSANVSDSTNVVIFPTGISLLSTGNTCADTLLLQDAEGVNEVIWYKDNTIIDTVLRGPALHGTTVAGGNGSGAAANQFDNPYGMALDTSGYVYVVDFFNHRVQKFPPGSTDSTNGVTVAGGNGPGNGANQLYLPQGIFVDNGGAIFVVDRVNSRIQRFPPGSTSATNGLTVAVQGLNFPTGVFVTASGDIYVADQGNQRIAKFTAGSTSTTTGTTVAGGNGDGDASNQLSYPNGVFVDTAGYLYVSDFLNHRVQKFPPGSTGATNGTTVAGGNGAGAAANQLNRPHCVYVDSHGALYVSEEFNNRIQKFPPGSNSTTNGVTVAGGNGMGAGDDQLADPFGMAIDRQGNIYVSDFSNNRVARWMSSGINTRRKPSANGSYKAKVLLPTGCWALSDAIEIEGCDDPLFARNKEHSTTNAPDTLGNMRVAIFPNPSHSYFTIVIQEKKELPLEVILTDVSGRILEQRRQSVDSGPIDVGRSLSSGIYFARVTCGNQQKVVKLIKQ